MLHPQRFSSWNPRQEASVGYRCDGECEGTVRLFCVMGRHTSVLLFWICSILSAPMALTFAGKPTKPNLKMESPKGRVWRRPMKRGFAVHSGKHLPICGRQQGAKQGESRKQKNVCLKSTTNNEVRGWMGWGWIRQACADRTGEVWHGRETEVFCVLCGECDHFAPSVVRAVGQYVVVFQPSERPNYTS